MGVISSKWNKWQKIPQIYKQLMQLNTEKQTTQSKSRQDLNRHFSKEDI